MMTPREMAMEVLAEALVMDASEIADDIALGVTPQWDSLAHLRLMLSIENRIQKRLDALEIVSITSLRDVIALLEREMPFPKSI